MGGVLIIAVVGAAALLFQLIDRQLLGPADHRADPDPAVHRWPGRVRRLPQRHDGRGHPHPPEADVAGRAASCSSPTRCRRRTPSARSPFLSWVTWPSSPWSGSLFAAFTIVATSNGVNFTDGLDGLAGGTLIFAFVAYMIIALLGGQTNLADPVRADHRRPAGLPVVQRPPGAGIHGRRRLARAWARPWPSSR